jgi:hypothetical protein
MNRATEVTATANATSAKNDLKWDLAIFSQAIPSPSACNNLTAMTHVTITPGLNLSTPWGPCIITAHSNDGLAPQRVSVEDSIANKRRFKLRRLHSGGRDEKWIDQRRLLYLPSTENPKKIGFHIGAVGVQGDVHLSFYPLDPRPVDGKRTTFAQVVYLVVESWSMSESKQPEDCPDQRLCNSKRIAEQRSSESDHADSDNFIVLHVRLEPETKIFLRLCGSILYDRVFREP